MTTFNHFPSRIEKRTEKKRLLFRFGNFDIVAYSMYRHDYSVRWSKIDMRIIFCCTNNKQKIMRTKNMIAYQANRHICWAPSHFTTLRIRSKKSGEKYDFVSFKLCSMICQWIYDYRMSNLKRKLIPRRRWAPFYPIFITDTIDRLFHVDMQLSLNHKIHSICEYSNWSICVVASVASIVGFYLVRYCVVEKHKNWSKERGKIVPFCIFALFPIITEMQIHRFAQHSYARIK